MSRLSFVHSSCYSSKSIPENSLECGECLQYPEGLRRCVSSRRQRTLFHQFLILQLGPEFSRNSRLRADALPADRAGTQTPAVASSAPARRDLTIPCGSNTNFFAAPLSKSR